VLAELEPAAAAAQRAAEANIPAPEPPKGDVIMYCTPWCPACRRARAYLAEKGIKYTEVDISKDRAAAARVRGWARGFETTPAFDIKGTIIVDFDQAKVAKALGIA